MAKVIANLINSHGLKVETTDEQVQNKIEILKEAGSLHMCMPQVSPELEWKKRINWLAQTPLKKVIGKCKFYYDLHDIFVGRASITPTATIDSFLDSDKEEKEDNSDDGKMYMMKSCQSIPIMNCTTKRLTQLKKSSSTTVTMNLPPNSREKTVKPLALAHPMVNLMAFWH